MRNGPAHLRVEPLGRGATPGAARHVRATRLPDGLWRSGPRSTWSVRGRSSHRGPCVVRPVPPAGRAGRTSREHADPGDRLRRGFAEYVVTPAKNLWEVYPPISPDSPPSTTRSATPSTRVRPRDARRWHEHGGHPGMWPIAVCRGRGHCPRAARLSRSSRTSSADPWPRSGCDSWWIRRRGPGGRGPEPPTAGGRGCAGDVRDPAVIEQAPACLPTGFGCRCLGCPRRLALDLTDQ